MVFAFSAIGVASALGGEQIFQKISQARARLER